MKLLSMLTLLVGLTAIAQDKPMHYTGIPDAPVNRPVVMNVERINEFVCVNQLHAFNVPACIKSMNQCVTNTLARRIMVSFDRSVITYAAIQECSLREPVYGNSKRNNNKKYTMINLRFENLEDMNRWVVWYLDQGGEEQSEFIVQDWDWNTMHLIDDKI